MPAVNKYSSELGSCLLDKANNSIDHILVNNILYIGFGPIKSQETHTFDYSIIIGMPSCAVDNVCNLIET